MGFAYDVKWTTLPTVSDAHRRHADVIKKENKSQVSHINVNDLSNIVSGIQPRHQWRHSFYTVTCVIGE